jgi:tetratricopeptide (TPR) repeat protein
MTLFSQANAALRGKNYAQAIKHYVQALHATPALAHVILPNHHYALRRRLKERASNARAQALVGGWDLSRNAAGRVFTLAQIWQALADTEIIGGFFPGKGAELWSPIRHLSIPIHSIPIGDERQFVEQATELVLQHPCDLLHLSKPRIPNILTGLLYKLIWGSRVLIDIDDEELAFVSAEKPLSLEHHLSAHGLPNPADLMGKEWTQIAVGLATAFDGVTVANSALQQRYGGVIVRHARDEQHFKPSAERRKNSRTKHSIAPGQKVILFLGTPRAHKGLLETAQTLASLGRKDTLLLVAGDFPPSLQKLKKEIETLPGLNARFLGNQPFESIPDLLAAGDICVVLQDPKSPAAQFQTPAKLSDALAMGLTVLAEPTPGLEDLSKAFRPVRRDSLAATLLQILERPSENPVPHPVFIEKLSLSANRPVLQSLLQQTPAAPAKAPLQALAGCREFGPLLSALWSEPRPASPATAIPAVPGSEAPIQPVLAKAEAAEPEACIQRARKAMALDDWAGAWRCWKVLFERQGDRLSLSLLLRISREFFRLDAFSDAAAALDKAARKDAAHPGVICEQAHQYYYHCYSSWLMLVTENEPDWYKADGLAQRPDWKSACELLEKAEKAIPRNNLRRYVQAHLLLAEESWDKAPQDEAQAALRTALGAIGPGRLDPALVQAILEAIGQIRQSQADQAEQENPQALQNRLKALPLDLLDVPDWLGLNDILNWNGLLLCGHIAREKAIDLAIKLGKAHPENKGILKSALKAALDRNDSARSGDFLDTLKQIAPDDIDVQELDACCELMKGHLDAFRKKWPHPPTPAEQRLRDYLKGKSVAVVGPAPTESQDGEEIDRFDVVVRMNWRGPENMPDAAEFGKRTDISLYNAHTVRLLRAREALGQTRALDFCLIRRPRHDRDTLPWEADRVCRIAEYPAVFYKSLNAAPAALFNLLLHGAERVKLFKLSFYQGKQQYAKGCRGRGDDFVDVIASRVYQTVVANHDLASQLVFFRALSSCRVELNKETVEIKNDVTQYLRLMEEVSNKTTRAVLTGVNRRKLMVVYEHKTQLKVAREIVSDLNGKNIDVSMLEYDSDIDYAPVFYRNLFLCDALILLIGGRQIMSFVVRLNKEFCSSGKKKRPLLISMVVGVVLDVVFFGTYYFRNVCDVVCVPRKKDAERVSRFYKAIGLRNKHVIDVKVPIFNRLPAVPNKSRDCVRGAIKTIMFIAQENIPSKLSDREYVVERLCEYAARYPDRKIVVKMKLKPGERGGHPQKFAYEKILKDKGGHPPNLLICYSDIVDLIRGSDLIVSVSSTAIIEAALLGKRIAVLNDFGILESFGNTYFVGSKCMRSFDEIIRDNVCFADRDWLIHEVEAPLFSERFDVFERLLNSKLIESPETFVALANCAGSFKDSHRLGVAVPSVPSRNNVVGDQA